MLQLVADFSIESDRKIYGIAHVPVIDRENELILADAVRKALPEYMKLPILHVQHTERPVGTVTKAYVDEQGRLHIYADIKDSDDTDDIWTGIKTGELNKFSIFGKRDIASPECALAPNQRVSPCVTKALTLFSISVVGDNAMNQETFLEVAKAFEERSDGMDKEEDKKDDQVEKCNQFKKEDTEDEVEKSDMPQESDMLLKDDRNLSGILERLGNIESTLSQLVESDKQVHDTMGKAEDEEEDEMEEKKEEKVEKAAPVVETPVVVETITKADLSGYITKAELDTIQKAHDELKKAYDDLTTRVTKMEQETIEKGGNVVIIQKDYLDANPSVDNLNAIGG